MSNKLYVGNLSFRVTSEDLQEYFGAAGAVESANVVYDRETGRSRGFGFVEMGSEDEATAAISQPACNSGAAHASVAGSSIPSSSDASGSR